MKQKLIFTICTYFLCVKLFAQSSSKQVYETNLLKNPGAESENTENKIPFWQSVTSLETWDFMNDTYGHTGGEWEWECDEKCGLPPNAGKNYFRFPVSNSYPEYGLWQEIDLSAYKDTLAKRKLYFSLSAYMAGFKCEQAGCGTGTLSIVFLDKEENQLAGYEAKKDNHDFAQANADDARMRKFELVSISNEIPTASVKAIITIEATTSDCCNDAYVFADNASFLVSKSDYRTK